MIGRNSQEADGDFSCGQQNLVANTDTCQIRLAHRKRSVAKMGSDDEASHDEAPAAKRQAVINNEPAVPAHAANHSFEKHTEQMDSADPLLHRFQHVSSVGAINLPSATAFFGYDGSIQTQAMLGPIWECANKGTGEEDQEWWECQILMVEYLNHVNDLDQQAVEEWRDVCDGWGDMCEVCDNACEPGELVCNACGQGASEVQGANGVGDEGFCYSLEENNHCCFCQDEEKRLLEE